MYCHVASDATDATPTNPGVLWVSGPDAAAFLQGQLSNDVEGLEPGTGTEAARLDRAGKIQHIMSVHRLASSERHDEVFVLLLEKECTSALKEDLETFHFSEDLEISNVTQDYHWAIIAGPESHLALSSVFGVDAMGPGYEEGRIIEGNDAFPGTLVMARSLIGDPGYVVGIRSDQDGFKAALERTASEFQLQLLNPGDRLGVFQVLRVEAGKFWLSQDSPGRPRVLPEYAQEQHWASYTKGCYLGQEVIARIRTYGSVAYAARGLVFATSDTPSAQLTELPEVGSNVQLDDGSKIGTWSARCFSPTLGAVVAFAFMNRDHRTPGKEIQIQVGKQSVSCRICMLPFYRPAGSKERAAQLYEDGIRAFARNDERGALNILEEALRIDPGFEDAYEAVGIILGREERFFEAIDFFRRLEEVAPNAPMVHTNLSLYHMKIGDKETAEKHAAFAMQKSLALSTGQPTPTEDLARKQQEIRQADAERKIAMFRQVLKIDPVDQVALFGLGNAHLVLKAWTTAEDFFWRARDADPENSAVYLGLGKALEAQNRLEEAGNIYAEGMDVAAKRGDLMPLKDMEQRKLLLEATMVSVPDVARRKEPKI